jgi:hypothetical protein
MFFAGSPTPRRAINHDLPNQYRTLRFGLLTHVNRRRFPRQKHARHAAFGVLARLLNLEGLVPEVSHPSGRNRA